MITLLCVGGVKDGERITFPEHQIQVRVVVQPALLSGQAVQTVIYERMRYACSNGEEFFVLTPAGQPSEVTMRLLIQNYRPQ